MNRHLAPLKRKIKKWRPIITVFAIIIVIFLFFENYQSLLYLKRIIFTNFDEDNFLQDIIYYLNESDADTYVNLLQRNFSFGNGKNFDTKWNKYLFDLNLYQVNTLNDSDVLNTEPVIATAVSSNHFRESLKMLHAISKVYQKKIVYIYDLGLSSIHRLTLDYFYGHIIINIKLFPFEKYPFYVSELLEFRWKPLVIADLLITYHSLIWMDASVRVLLPLDKIYSRFHQCLSNVTACSSYPWMLIFYSGHSIFSATHMAMYDFLPMPIDAAKNLTMWSATAQLIYGTKEIRESVLRYWVLCALERECMDPNQSSLKCHFARDRYTQYAGCNRQDQSAINIILANANSFDETRYSSSGDNVVTFRKDNI